MDRRNFVGAMGALAVLPGVRGSGGAGFLGGLQSPITDRQSLDKIGLQLYTVRAAMAESVERTLFEVARLGYREVEFAGYFDRPPRAIKQLLDRNDLSAPSAHISIADMRGGWFRRLEDAAEVDHKWLVIPSLPAADRDSLDAIKRTAETLNRAAQDAKSYKIRIGYHNHDIEFQEVEGRVMFDVLLEETDPKLVEVELDLYWITKAGADPLAYFARWPGRFPLMHVKDSAGAPEHRMTEVGKGAIDFARIFAARKQSGMKHVYVEHDNPTDPMASVATSYRYLKALEF